MDLLERTAVRASVLRKDPERRSTSFSGDQRLNQRQKHSPIVLQTPYRRFCSLRVLVRCSSSSAASSRRAHPQKKNVPFFDDLRRGNDGARVRYPQLRAMTTSASDNLRTFFVVGVVEQYEGFIEVLKHALDQEGKHSSLWKAALAVRKNG